MNPLYQSDHKSFTFKFFSHIRPTTQRRVIQYRSFKTIDIDNFKSDIHSSSLYTNPAYNSSDLSEQLSSTLNWPQEIQSPMKFRQISKFESHSNHPPTLAYFWKPTWPQL